MSSRPKPKSNLEPNSDPPSSFFLSPTGYDDDASSLRSLSEQDSDSEDDEFLRNSRSTLELNAHDRAVLEEEEELEKLLTRRGPAGGLRRIFSGGSHGSVRIGKRDRRRRKKGKKLDEDGDEGERGELMFEMEERYQDHDHSYDDNESARRLGTPSVEMGDFYSQSQKTTVPWRRLLLIFSVILVLFLIIFLGAYKASSGYRLSHRHRQLRSNGTALFAPTTILISLDGFRADFLNRGLTPTLNALIADGVSPRYMTPSFPSVTFPNHFTLVTGLYPESHGIVGNTFWDPALQDSFYYTRQEISMQAKWWNAEPLWVTAEKLGVPVAVHMWPGSEAHIEDMDPTFLDKFNGSEALTRKVDRILHFLDLPGEEAKEPVNASRRPQFIAAYVPNVDADGHKYGPNSTEIRSTIASVDEMLASLFAGIQNRNLTDIVNIIVVSDHGMATTSIERLVQLDDFVDLNLIERIDGWPSRGLRPKKSDDIPVLMGQLAKMVAKYPHAVEVYNHQTMPERYHFTDNDRIAPLWVIPKAGWAIVERPNFDVSEALENRAPYHPKGIHGYDHEHPLMRAIFIARGPAFPHPPNSRLDTFQNIEVYNIICDSLGLAPLPNNGTLRLPLQPVGLHSDEVPVVVSPEDPPVSTGTSAAPYLASEVFSPDSSSVGLPNPSSPTHTTTLESDGGSGIEDSSKDNSESDENEPDASWWQSALDKWNDFKDWATQLLAAEKDNHPSR